MAIISIFIIIGVFTASACYAQTRRGRYNYRIRRRPRLNYN